MDKVAKNIVGQYNKALQKKIVEVFGEEAVPKIIDIIMEEYDLSLNGVANPKSKLAPEQLMDEFNNRLLDFNYIGKQTGKVSLIIPDIENFPFHGKLRPIQNILEGMTGRYVEVDGRDYRQATGKQTYRGKYIRKDVVYLFKQREARPWERIVKKKFDIYVFSNTPPIDIFGHAQIFVEDNMDKWINEAIIQSQRGIK